MKREFEFYLLLVLLIIGVLFMVGDNIAKAAPLTQVEAQQCDHVFTSDGSKMYRCYDEDFDIVCYSQGWIPFCLQP